MSEDKHGHGPAATVGLIGLVLLPGLRFCDDAARVGRFADDVPIPTSSVNADDWMRGRPGHFPTDLNNPAIRHGDSLVLQNLDQLHPGERVMIEDLHLAGIPDQDFDALNRVHDPVLISGIPTNARDYHAVYGRELSGSARRGIDRLNVSLAQEGAQRLPARSSIDTLFSQIESADGNPVVIVAHSQERGRRLVLPDGSLLDVADVHRGCLERSRKCLVLTCYGDDFALNSRLSAARALEMWRAAALVRTRAGGALSMDNYIEAFRAGRPRRLGGTRIVITWALAGPGAPASMVVSYVSPLEAHF